MKYIFLTSLALVATIVARAEVMENIHPWEFLWVVWVLVTALSGGCVGYTIARYRKQRKSKK